MRRSKRGRREDAEIHWCDETGAAADQQHDGYAARGGGEVEITIPHPHEPDLDDSNEGSVHHDHKETMTAALLYVRSEC